MIAWADRNFPFVVAAGMAVVLGAAFFVLCALFGATWKATSVHGHCVVETSRDVWGHVVARHQVCVR